MALEAVDVCVRVSVCVQTVGHCGPPSGPGLLL